MVTTKRSPSTRSVAKNNNSSHSPFNDDDEEDSKARHGKDIRNSLSNGSVTGNGVLANMNIIQNEHGNNHKNNNLSHYHFEDIWTNGDNKRNGGLKYSPKDETDGFEPDIIPIKTKNMGNNDTGLNDDLKHLLRPIDPSLLHPSNESPQPFQSHKYNQEDDDNNTNTISSGIQQS